MNDVVFAVLVGIMVGGAYFFGLALGHDLGVLEMLERFRRRREDYP